MNNYSESNSRNKLSKQDLSFKIESALKNIFKQGSFSGVILLARKDEEIYHSCQGYASVPLRQPPNLDTKFNLGSMNKMFTSVAIAQLVQKGKLSFDDTVASILTDAKIDQSESIKVKHLLTHTSGLGNFFTPEYMKNKANYLEISDLLPLIEKEKLAFSPGERFQYSNSGFEVLGMIIERISGKSYFDFVKENVFLPAGMTNSDSYRIDEQISNIAEGYTQMSMNNPDVKEKLHSNKQMARIKGSAAGGGYSTAKDLLLFSKALFSYKLLEETLTKEI
ncbi:MAG: serine hydrolase domain-containing protein, partial [Candidatus Heimdallarchaeaceae archaeon]